MCVQHIAGGGGGGNDYFERRGLSGVHWGLFGVLSGAQYIVELS